MPKLSILAGATSQSVNIFIQDSSSTVGAGLSGLVFNTSGLICYYTFAGANATATAVTLATLAAVNSAFSSGGFKEIDATNMKGLYRLDIPNAALATSKGRSVVLMLGGATNMAQCVLEIELTGWDNQDAVHGGLSSLPNTACTTNASLLTSGTGTDQLSVTSGRIDAGKWLGTTISTPATAGVPDVNAKAVNNVATTSVTTINANQGTTQPVNFTGTGASALAKSDMVDIAGAAVSTSSAQIGVNSVNVGGTAQTGRDIGASVLLSAGTGAGQLDFTSGVVKASLVQILGTALTETVGQIAAGFKQFFNIGSPTSTMNLITAVTTTTTATNLTNAPTSGDFTATMKTSLNAATPTVTVGTNNDKTGYSLATLDSRVLQSGTAQAGAAGTITLASGASATDSLYRGQEVEIYGGTGAGQARVIVGYVGSTKVATVDENWITNPDNTSTYRVVHRSPKMDSSQQVVAASVQGNVTGSVASVTGNVGGSVGSVTGAVGSVTGNVGGNVTGSVGSVTASVSITGDLSATMKTSVTTACTASTPTAAAVTGDVGGNVTGSVGSVVADVGITQAAADKVFGSSGAAMAELSGVPSATPSPRNALMLIFMALRNKLTTTATAKTVFNDAGSSIAAKTLSDDGTVYTETKLA